MTTKEEIQPRRIGRRQFLTESGSLALGAVGIALVGCESDGTPKEGFEEARIPIENLPDGKEEIYLQDAFPRNLVVRKGSEMTVVGTIKDQNGRENVVCLITDPLRKTPDGTSQSFKGILPEPSFTSILSADGGGYDAQKGIVSLPNGKKGKVQELDSATFELEKAKAGAFFVDVDPLKKNPDGTHPLHTNPVVTEPPIAIKYNEIKQSEDRRVLALDESGNSISRARYYPWRNEWRWVTRKEAVGYYTIRELNDALGLTFGTFVRRDKIRDPRYVEMLEEVANQLMIAVEVDMDRVFKPFTLGDWKRVISEWDSISGALNKRQIPGGFQYYWTEADEMISFAQKEGMGIRGKNLLRSFEIPDIVYNNSTNFTNEDLEKIFEFSVKARMLKYKGVIKEWDGVAESIEHSLYGKGKISFLYQRFGTYIVDKIYIWAHEVDPEAKLVFSVDGVLEPNMDARQRIKQEFFKLLRHFKDNGIPVDKISIQNNFWVYQPPKKGEMANILREIKQLGFDIASAETTVSISEQRPIGIGRRDVSVSDKYQAQAQIYRDLLEAYLEVGNEFGVAGFTDSVSWISEIGHPEAEPLIFDTSGMPKPTYYAILEVLFLKFLKMLLGKDRS